MYKLIHEIKLKERCTSVLCDRNFDEYIAYSEGDTLKVFNKLDLIVEGESADPIQRIKTSNDIVCTKMNSSGDKLVISNMDTISIYDIPNNFNKIFNLKTGMLRSWKFDFHPSKNELATGNYSVDIYDIDSAEKISILQNDLKYIYSLLYLDGQTLSVGNANGSINIFSLETLKVIHKIEENCMPIRAMANDKKNNKMISCSDDLHINILDSTNFKVNLSLVGHKDIITSVSVNDENGLYASSSHDGTIKTWDIRQSKCVQTIHLHNPSVNEEDNYLWDLSFSLDGKTLICGSEFGFHLLSLS